MLPLVSCVMPTFNRRAFVPHAIRYFLRQDYQQKELIIIDDGTDDIRDLVPEIPGIRYIRLAQKITLGAKLNMACSHAKGNIIVNWDDDDWYAPNRLTYQVQELQQSNTDVCGINHLLYFDLRDKKAYKYIYPADQRIWLLGSSLCYKKETWNNHQFADINVGMDGLFVWEQEPSRVRLLQDHRFAVHMIHPNNVSPKKTDGAWWNLYPVEEISSLMGTDWLLYSTNGNEPNFKLADGYKLNTEKTVSRPSKKIKNVFACLVHEKEDCITDLIRNLHYHDPDAAILLFNGSEKPGLIDARFPFSDYNATVHPLSNPLKWGYLHQFALSCMEYALSNFTFDTLTIVDSDQLCVRNGYSDYLQKFLSGQSSRIGMFSCRSEKVDREHTHIYPAIQAFREYELWKPLLQSFPDGEKHFVYWTFWPSTVFTADAARDLIKMFRENVLLQQIMSRTRIWATEEIILPTLVKLLGYEIAENPCSYDFVKYRYNYSLQDVETALLREDVYWMHPIERNYDNSLRKFIRTQCNDYEVKKSAVVINNDEALTLYSAIKNKIKPIEGWLSEQEADLLIDMVQKVCTDIPGPHRIVETGTYHGKTTILLGSTAITFSDSVKVYAVDMHDGKLGAADGKLLSFPPSLEMCKKNIEAAGLNDNVEIIQDRSYNVKWQLPVSFIFVDGLHDYFHVSSDFWHFADWLVPGGYAAFHDYAGYYPGVQSFVHDLLKTGTYRKVKQAGSLIILEKLYESHAIN